MVSITQPPKKENTPICSGSGLIMAKGLRPALNASKQSIKKAGLKRKAGLWPSGLRHTHGVRGIGGSNPPSPTKKKTPCSGVFFSKTFCFVSRDFILRIYSCFLFFRLVFSDILSFRNDDNLIGYTYFLSHIENKSKLLFCSYAPPIERT